MSTPEQLLWYADSAPVDFPGVPDGSAERNNAQCGDHCVATVWVRDSLVFGVKMEVEGCAVCRGVAGWLQECARGVPVSTVLAWSPLHAVTSWGLALGPLRRKCAALPVETLLAALHASPAHQRDRSPL